MLYVTRRAEFSAAHRLFCPELSDEENHDLFGPCSHPSGHGHNYVLEVTVKGEVDPATGMVINLRDLKQVMQEEVLDQVDHRHLDIDTGLLDGKVSTAENLTVAIWRRLQNRVGPALLHRVRVYETARNFADYYGPESR